MTTDQLFQECLRRYFKWVGLFPERVDGHCCNGQGEHADKCARDKAWREYIEIRDQIKNLKFN